MTDMTTDDITRCQAAGRLFSEIASGIDRIRGLLHNDDDIVSNTAVTAVESLARLGWLADVGARAFGEAAMNGVDPTDWMTSDYTRRTLHALQAE